MRILKRIFKIILIVVAVLFLGLLITAHIFMSPSSDEKILEKLNTSFSNPQVFYNDYKGFEYRIISMQKEVDTTLPILVFVHGSPGSAMDYQRYLKDSLLNAKSNIVAYERVGYGPNNLR